MPTNEAIELHETLKGLPQGQVLLNAFVAPRFTGEELETLQHSESTELNAAKAAAAQYRERQELSAFYEEKLKQHVSISVTRLPFLSGLTFGRAEVEQLAASLTAEF
jgi:hypothetical protein